MIVFFLVLLQETLYIGATLTHIQLLHDVVKDMFEACKAKCRTTSQSVQHENKFVSL